MAAWTALAQAYDRVGNISGSSDAYRKSLAIDPDQIDVWISFGNFAMYSFRNYPIPGAGGPSPMVAAFWDDLTITSSGNVY